MTRKTNRAQPITSSTQIERQILLIRGEKVMLDTDLAALYQVETRALTQAVKRNIERFPEDFMFQLSKEEFDHLRSQTVTSSWGGRRYPPYAFTEQGYDRQFKVVFDAIRQLMAPPEPAKKRPIGFVWDSSDKKDDKGR